MSETQRQLARLRQNVAAATNRAHETPEKRAARLAKGREYARRKRAAEDPAEKAARLARQRDAGKIKQRIFACAQNVDNGAEVRVESVQSMVQPSALIGWQIEESKPMG